MKPVYLVVSPRAKVREYLHGVLQSCGYAVVTANNLAAAMDKAITLPPQAVLLDARLPRAAEAVAFIRDGRVRLPVVLITHNLHMLVERPLFPHAIDGYLALRAGRFRIGTLADQIAVRGNDKLLSRLADLIEDTAAPTE